MSGDWISQLSQPGWAEGLKTIIYIGAGSGEALEACLETGADEIILSEPDNALFPLLENRALDDKRITVFPVAIADTSGQSSIYVMNFSALSSIYKPKGLYELFPGLRQVEERLVDTLSIVDFLSAVIPEHRDGAHMLLINAPGVEHIILKDLFASEYKKYFSYISVRGASRPLYENGVSVAELRAVINGSYRIQTQSTEDEDFPILWLQYDPSGEEISRLMGEVQALNAQVQAESQQRDMERIVAEGAIADLEGRLAAAETARKDLAREYDLAVQARDQFSGQAQAARRQLDEAQSAAKSAMSDLESRLAAAETARKDLVREYDLAVQARDQFSGQAQAARRQLDEVQSAAKSAMSDLESRLAAAEMSHKDLAREYDLVVQARDQFSGQAQAAQGQLDEARSTAKSAMSDLEGRLAKAEASLAQVTEKSEWRYKHNQELEAALSAQKARVSQLEAEVKSLRTDVSISVRGQSLAQLDLRDLQQRYQDVFQQKVRQEQLLKELTPRLQTAAYRLHDMLGTQATASTLVVEARPENVKKGARVNKNG